MSLEKALNFRRAVRNYAPDANLDTEKVKQCLELATLAPTSSNMQLYEFYHITDKATMSKISEACLGQNATATANQMVVFVTRRDLHRKRAKEILDFEYGNIERHSPEERKAKRIKDRELYYGKLMPFVYSRFFGLLGLFRKGLMSLVSLFRPIITAVSENDTRIVVHKSCGLVVQTFMMAMAEQGYDTCPLEGYDSRRMKRILNLPCAAEINMVITCGIRNGEKGIFGERYRVPFDEVYHTI